MATNTPPPVNGGPTAQQRYGFSGSVPGGVRAFSRGAGSFGRYGPMAKKPPNVQYPWGDVSPPPPPPPISDLPGTGGGGLPGTGDTGGGGPPDYGNNPGGLYYMPDVTYNPYPDLPDFAGRSINVPGGPYHFQPGVDPSYTANVARTLAAMQAGQFGNLPSLATVTGMQGTLNNIRGMGGIKYGSPGVTGTMANPSRTGGLSAAQIALRLRRRASAGKAR